MENVKALKSHKDDGFMADLLTFFAAHLDSSLLYALESYEDPEVNLVIYAFFYLYILVASQ